MKKDKDLKIVGIRVRTMNKRKQAAKEIGALWQTFYTESIINKIPHRVGSDVYVVYTDYESDYKGEYTCLIGCPVKLIDYVPEGLIGRKFTEQPMKHFVAKGKAPKSIGDTWEKIWELEDELNRSYTYDLEVYGERSQSNDNAEIDIYIGIKE